MDHQISVIIPTANRPEALAHALASLRAQEIKDIQAVVVNDGGADVTEAVAPFRADFALELLELEGNRGPSAARNAALEIADGDFVTFLDDDDVLLPGHFDAVLPVLASGEADVVYTTMLVSDVRAEPTAEGYRDARPAFNYDFDRGFLLMANYIPPLGLTMRRPAPAGPRFDPAIRLAEDWELWLRMDRDGYRFHHVPAATAVYHRLPRHEHKADPTGAESQAVHAFQVGYSHLCELWPVAADSPAARGRALVQRAYEIGFVQLDEHKTSLSPFWWESMLRVLHDQNTGELAQADVEAALYKAVTGVTG
ncbi:MAG TPA: glycosyltransferase family 2 protein [Actinospica sp.]|nr:glycosyltransferase family 2 protein [Actinospica sp.]